MFLMWHGSGCQELLFLSSHEKDKYKKQKGKSFNFQLWLISEVRSVKETILHEGKNYELKIGIHEKRELLFLGL